jgi:hypothetical protein
VNAVFKTHSGGQAVRRGSYWNPASGEWVTFGEEGGVLPLGPGRYVRMAPVLMLLLGPILGLLYWLLLPGVFFAVLVQFVAAKAGRGMRVVWRTIVSHSVP